MSRGCVTGETAVHSLVHVVSKGLAGAFFLFNFCCLSHSLTLTRLLTVSFSHENFNDDTTPVPTSSSNSNYSITDNGNGSNNNNDSTITVDILYDSKIYIMIR